MRSFPLLLLAFTLVTFSTQAQSRQGTEPIKIQPVKVKNDGLEHLNWNPIFTEAPSEGNEKQFLFFEGAQYFHQFQDLPTYVRLLPVANGQKAKVTLERAQYESVSVADLKEIGGTDLLLAEPLVVSNNLISAKQHYTRVQIVPLRRTSTGFEKLVAFKLNVAYEYGPAQASSRAQTWASHSVLSSGEWYKVAVSQDGVHRITRDDLVALGVNIDGLDPRTISIYGNGGGMLPERNDAFRHDDLVENAIEVTGESDGSFDAGDEIRFYGQGPHRWKEDTVSCLRFAHTTHLYSNKTYYFIRVGSGSGKRLSTQGNSDLGVTNTVTTFDDYAFHEAEEVNLLKSGRDWYGELFDITTDHEVNFNFSNVVGGAESQIAFNGLIRSIGAASSFAVDLNGNDLASVSAPTVTGEYYQKFADFATTCETLSGTGGTLNLDIHFNKANVNSKAWLNKVDVNVRRNLTMAGGQVIFRDLDSRGTGNVSEFRIGNANGATRVWEVTDPTDVAAQQLTLAGSTVSFRLTTDELREFVAFDGTLFYSVELIGSVANQDLHGLSLAEMVIVAHPDFTSEANRLASFHRNNPVRPLTVHVVEPGQVFNEFSSGAQDVSAIRNFMKMFYDRAGSDPSQGTRYLLMFGDASYDYKDVVAGNTNFVPTYESFESLNPTQSYVSDDYFGHLDDSEGYWSPTSTDALDIGVGRFPVRTIEDAAGVVDKIYRYEEVNAAGSAIGDQQVCANGTSAISAPDWRNRIVFIGDDEDGNMHFNQADQLSTLVDTTYPEYNIVKIFLDSYIQQSTPGGQRYPEARIDLNNNVNRGALIVNYTGHGGELGWTHERVLGIGDINAWTNMNNLPAFVTATCEFSRYDDPSRVSAGELVLLNPNGGGIALFTTSRLVYSAPNFALNKKFYENLFVSQPWGDPTMGDIIRMTKVAAGNSVNNRNFSLLGDPAQRLAYPEHKVITTSINGIPVTAGVDTMKALQLVTVTGKMQHKNGSDMPDFNGVIFPTIYDKETTVSTLGNDPASSASPFKVQKSLLYRGKASVTNGEFSFQFVVPKDIAYNVDFGRLSYYAENDLTNANGYFENFYIGGANEDAAADDEGPDVSLYMNDENFVYGGTTDENPLLLAVVNDANGINTVGNGIGHDLTAVLDENTANTISLNDYYQSDLDSYQSGRISYPFSELSEGTHNLRVKVWDVYNNSSESYTEFVVAESANLALDHVLNYPNPFTTRTQFHFEHNQACSDLSVQVQVFTVSGKLVKTINESVHNDGYKADPIDWDGLDDYGQKIGRGVYVYNLKVTTPDGQTAEQLEKLVILN